MIKKLKEIFEHFKLMISLHPTTRAVMRLWALAQIIITVNPDDIAGEKRNRAFRRFNRLWLKTSQEVRDLFASSFPTLYKRVADYRFFKAHPEWAMKLAINEEKKGGEQQ